MSKNVDHKYKPSYYNCVHEQKSTALLYNTYTGAMASLVGPEGRMARAMLQAPNDPKLRILNPEIWQRLLDNEFIVNQNLDEVDFIRIRLLKSQFNVHGLTFTMLPTRNCNCRCVYCFEDQDSGSMTGEDCNEIIEFVKAQVEENKPSTLQINWYGGEPLLKPDIISRLSKDAMQICREFGVSYHATMVSNGYLLSEALARELNDLKVRSIQITLDGPEHVHNQRRILKSGGPTYHRIKEAILIAKGIFERVDIRVHVDKENQDSVFTLLEEDWLYGDNVTITPGYLRDYNPSCADWSAACKAVQATGFHNIQQQFDRIVSKRIMKKEDRSVKILVDSIPVRTRYCGADYMGNWAIGPGARVFKCISALNKADICGHLKNGRFRPNNNYSIWFLDNPLENQKCKICRLLPLCMGGCIAIRKRYPSVEESGICEYWSHYLEEKLRTIDQMLNEHT